MIRYELICKKYLTGIVCLYQHEINYGFISSLGPHFIKFLCKNIIHSDTGIGYVAIDGKEVVGFIIVTTDLKKFHMRFLIHYSFFALFLSLSKLLTISSIKSVYQNILYPSSKDANIELPKTELIAIATSSSVRGQGVGKQLLDRVIETLNTKNIKALKVLVGDELKSNGFYMKMGFKLVNHINYNSNKMNANVYLKEW
jgi:ribosomal protein S18 acetylase RimI-like enzyme